MTSAATPAAAANTVDLATPLQLPRGPAWANRLALAPLTNFQSHDDGTLADDEFQWLTRRAQGGFSLTMTCAAYVHPSGKGFPGQLGISGDEHLPGLRRLAQAIRDAGSVSSVQLQHSGLRAEARPTGQPLVAPFDDAETGARRLSTDEVRQVVRDFVAAAVRAEQAGFDGVEIHGAHGYLLAEFLDADHNLRDDGYGGSAAGRARILDEILDGVRARTGPQFQVGLRLSPERWGIRLDESLPLAERMMAGGAIDYLDMSLWDVRKPPKDPAGRGQPLIDLYAALPRGRTPLGVAGKLMSAADARFCLGRGVDFVLIGRGAILHEDFARRAIAEPGFASVPRPVSRAYLASQGVGPKFVEYLATTWGDFVEK